MLFVLQGTGDVRTQRGAEQLGLGNKHRNRWKRPCEALPGCPARTQRAEHGREVLRHACRCCLFHLPSGMGFNVPQLTPGALKRERTPLPRGVAEASVRMRCPIPPAGTRHLGKITPPHPICAFLLICHHNNEILLVCRVGGSHGVHVPRVEGGGQV